MANCSECKSEKDTLVNHPNEIVIYGKRYRKFSYEENKLICIPCLDTKLKVAKLKVDSNSIKK